MRYALFLLCLPGLLVAQPDDLDGDLNHASVTSLTSFFEPAAPSYEDEIIARRNEEALAFARRPDHFKLVVDKDRSRMAVFDRDELIGVFAVSLGSNSSEDGYGRFVGGKSPRNTPVGVFRTGPGRPSVDGFTWFIPYEVPGRSAMGIHGPKSGFWGYLAGFIHWTRGCVALTSKADILRVKDAYARARARGTPARLIIAREMDFSTIPGW